MEYLFSYGTLQDLQVQQYIFGRLLKGKADAALGFKKMENAVYGRYPLVVSTKNLGDKVAGMAYEVNDLYRKFQLTCKKTICVQKEKEEVLQRRPAQK